MTFVGLEPAFCYSSRCSKPVRLKDHLVLCLASKCIVTDANNYVFYITYLIVIQQIEFVFINYTEWAISKGTKKCFFDFLVDTSWYRSHIYIT